MQLLDEQRRDHVWLTCVAVAEDRDAGGSEDNDSLVFV